MTLQISLSYQSNDQHHSSTRRIDGPDSDFSGIRRFERLALRTVRVRETGFRLRAAAEQLVFPFQLRMGDVVLDDGVRLEVVGLSASMSNGKTTRAWVRREGDAVQREAVGEVWRKLHVIRTPAA